MRSRRDRDVLPGLRTLFLAGSAVGLTDGQLLECFATRDGEAAELAFAVLVERHGPMVLRTCRAVLRDEHDARDAFQATFLILARRGGSLWVGTRSARGCTGSPAARRSGPGATPDAGGPSSGTRSSRRIAPRARRAIPRSRPSSTRRWTGSPIGIGSRWCSATWTAARTRRRRGTWAAPSGRSRAGWPGGGNGSGIG